MNIVDPLFLADIISIFEKDLGPGGWLYIDPVTQKITPKQTGIDHDRPWIYTNPNPKMFCNFYQSIFYGTIGKAVPIIPQRCLNCYKVVVKMHSVVQLMRMYDFQKQFTQDCIGRDRFCKCGVEERDWVHYNYGAYFYNHGEVEGLLRHKQVKENMIKLFGKDGVGKWDDGKVEVILKRGCTEFEIKMGPSNKWTMTEQQKLLHDKIFQHLDLKKSGIKPPDFVNEHVILRWLNHAWKIGDSTVKIFNDNNPFYTPVVTYHDKEQTNG